MGWVVSCLICLDRSLRRIRLSSCKRVSWVRQMIDLQLDVPALRFESNDLQLESLSLHLELLGADLKQT